MTKTTVQKITAIVLTESHIAERNFNVIIRKDGKIFSNELVEWISKLSNRINNFVTIVRNDGRKCFYIC